MGCRAFAVAILLIGGVAAADTVKPWAVGVPEAKQALALQKFQDGNALFVKAEWPKALELYLAALAEWDHPNIRYNAAICLIKLGRMLEAHDHMAAALRYGEAPLGKDLYEQGQTYFQVLKSSVSHLEVVCKAPAGARVTVDGVPLLDTCPRSATKLVEPGKHQIVSSKPGYRTETVDVQAPAGGRETVTIVMQLEGTRKLTRRWPRWVPWIVVGSGA